jgi:hypothetical protein
VFTVDVTQGDIDQASPKANPLVAALTRLGARQVSYASRIVRFDLDGAAPWRDVASNLGWINVFRIAGLAGLLNGRYLTEGIKTISWSGFVDEATYEALLAWTRGTAVAPFTGTFKAQAMEINP